MVSGIGDGAGVMSRNLDDVFVYVFIDIVMKVLYDLIYLCLHSILSIVSSASAFCIQVHFNLCNFWVK